MGTYQHCSAGSSKLLTNMRDKVKKTVATIHNMTSLRVCTYAPRTPSYYKSNVCYRPRKNRTARHNKRQKGTTKRQNARARAHTAYAHIRTYVLPARIGAERFT